MRVKSNLSKIKKETKKDQESKKNALHNIEMVYKARDSVNKLYVKAICQIERLWKIIQ